MTYSREPSDGPETWKVMSYEELKDVLEAADMRVESVGEMPGFQNKLRRFGRLFKAVGGGLQRKALGGLLTLLVILAAIEVGLLGVLRFVPEGGVLQVLLRGLFHLIGLYVALSAGYLLSVPVLHLPILAGARIFLGGGAFETARRGAGLLFLLLTLASPAVLFLPLPWSPTSLVARLYLLAALLGIGCSGLYSARLSKDW